MRQLLKEVVRRMKPKKKLGDPPSADTLEFTTNGLRAIYEHLIILHDRVGRLEGTQKVILALVLAVTGAIISVAVKVWGG